MKYTIIILFLLGCNTSNNNTFNNDTSTSEESWENDIIINYIDNSRQFTETFEQDTSIHIEWWLEFNEETDTAVYHVYRIGHDVSDENGESLRFVTDAWLYIDSLTHKAYKYDTTNDSLIKL